MEGIDKQSNFIGLFFKEYIFRTRFNRRELARLLNFNYADNDRMICAYLSKKDYLWKEYEVREWCNVLQIREGTPVHSKLVNKAGIKSYGNDK